MGAAYRKPIELSRRERMLKTAIARNSSPDRMGAIECACASQLLHSILWEAAHDKNCPEDLLKLAADTLPLIRAAAREPFRAYTFKLGDELIAASADLCMLVKAKCIDSAIKPVAYFYTVYLWLDELLKRGPERGGLALDAEWTFGAAWERIAQEVALSADLLPEIERSCQKRARRFKEAFESYGFFVDPTAGQMREAA
ncbi:hypothetical protein M5E06_17690 [Azospirillum sp. A1-3]|uniref:hypothetical protein n=1 Tax=Azospirillum sp. A1-3 TaxID=185874 RepID=UPI0020776FCB|nr:hypothetical protein [Azospirillum sp. A1-3]MCM8735968.1 hypothetical protein [Azospirillum sp. A1-3]